MPDTATTASELRVALGQLMRRLRVEQVVPLPQISVLARLVREGPRTTSDLAAAERIRPQSMSQTVAELEGKALVSRRPDPLDGRRILIELTDRGNQALEVEVARRDDWLTNAIADALSRQEQNLLEQALPLLRRLAEHGG